MFELSFCYYPLQYSCCGHYGPSDWRYRSLSNKYDFTSLLEHTLGDDMIENSITIIDDDDTVLEDRKKISPPPSCCKSKNCNNYHSVGCFQPLWREIARVVGMVKSVAMISSILQVGNRTEEKLFCLNFDLHFFFFLKKINRLIVNHFRWVVV